MNFTFTSAGCIFYNEQYILAGYQPRKQKPIVSGLGGKREGDEEASTTALRETLEELFELQTVPLEWIQEIQATIPFQRSLQNGDYLTFLYSFDDLQQILVYLESKGCQSELYNEFPTNVLTLLFHRKQLAYPAEISHLLLFPLVNHPKDSPFVDRHFLSDIRLLLTKPGGPVDT
jgi:hypothetical protein